jgi:type III restriction enzyme
MARKKATSSAAPLLDVKVTTAPCVLAIRDKVTQWRDTGYPGATDTTQRLLHYWFLTDHRLANGRKFAYQYSQRYAVETLVYLYEIARVRSQKGLIEAFAHRQDLKLLQYDQFARYCVKMATGSGKTKVMALAIAWQYFNAIAEGRDDYAKAFLVIAPNVIVFERLRTDFGGGRIFHLDPIVPDDLRIYWDFQCYMRGEGERAGSLGALYVTNIQQLYERPESGSADEPEIMTAVLGPKPPAQGLEVEDFLPRLVARGGPVAVLNDEAHHTHDEESQWNQCIRRLHTSLLPSPPEGEGPGVRGIGVGVQFDFTATPRHTKGQLFSWTVYDYPLKQAIFDGIVKRPLKGIAKGIAEQKSEIASVRYQAYLAAGVERWKEYREQLAPLNRKPILFIMMNDTTEADDVGDWLQKKYPAEFGGDKLLVIHTDKTGEVSKKDLDKARHVARSVDDEKSPVHCSGSL